MSAGTSRGPPGATPPELPKQYTPARYRLTASWFAAAVGVDPWRSRRDAWLYALGRVEPRRDNANQARGRRQEVDLVATYAHLVDAVVDPAGQRVHRTHRFLAAQADGVVGRGDCRRAVEVKSRRRMDDAVPAHVVPQLVGEMACYEVREVDYVCGTADGRLRVWRVAWSDEYWRWLEVGLRRFWHAVRTRRAVPDAPDGDAPPPPRIHARLLADE